MSMHACIPQVLFALGDEPGCKRVVEHALQLNPFFSRGLDLRQSLQPGSNFPVEHRWLFPEKCRLKGGDELGQPKPVVDFTVDSWRGVASSRSVYAPVSAYLLFSFAQLSCCSFVLFLGFPSFFPPRPSPTSPLLSVSIRLCLCLSQRVHVHQLTFCRASSWCVRLGV